MGKTSAFARLAAYLFGRKAGASVDDPTELDWRAGGYQFPRGSDSFDVELGYTIDEKRLVKKNDDDPDQYEVTRITPTEASLVRVRAQDSMRPRSYLGRQRVNPWASGSARPMATRRPGTKPEPPSDYVRPDPPAKPPKPIAPPIEIFREDDTEPLKETTVMKYIGRPESDDYAQVGMVVRVDEKGELPLDPRYDLRNHSPTGFAWAYAGSGPAQLALAILADATGDDATALRHYQQFKFDKIAVLPRGTWKIDSADVLDWLGAQDYEHD